jgi:hypothetical protein
MRISFDNYSVEMSSHANRAELETKLRNSGGPYEVFERKDHEHLFYSLELRPEFTNLESHRRSFGLCGSTTGVEPQVLISASSRCLYVGMDSTLFILSIFAAPPRRLELGSPFYWMTLFHDLNKILVVHEIGLLCINVNGDLLWQQATDIIASAALSKDHRLEVLFMGGGGIDLDLHTGKVLP